MFRTLLFGSSTCLPNSAMSHLFSIPYTGSQLKKKRIDFKLASLCYKSPKWFCPHLSVRPSSPLHSFSAPVFLYRHLSVQNTLLSHKVKWSALFLVPNSNNMGPTPRFYPSRILCQFLQIFLENLPLFENFFLSPPALRRLCVSRCVFVCRCVGVCACGGACVCFLNFWCPHICMC